jgi:hypothetical protein
MKWKSKKVHHIFKGPSKKFIDKEENASNNTQHSCNNIYDKMSRIEKVGSPQYIRRKDQQ